MLIKKSSAKIFFALSISALLLLQSISIVSAQENEIVLPSFFSRISDFFKNIFGGSEITGNSLRLIEGNYVCGYDGLYTGIYSDEEAQDFYGVQENNFYLVCADNDGDGCPSTSCNLVCAIPGGMAVAGVGPYYNDENIPGDYASYRFNSGPYFKYYCGIVDALYSYIDGTNGPLSSNNVIVYEGGNESGGLIFPEAIMASDLCNNPGNYLRLPYQNMWKIRSYYDVDDSDSSVCVIEESTCTDSDGDGFNIEGGECGLIDCNDNDASVNPSASELCNGVDENCNGQVDEIYNVGSLCSAGVGECADDGVQVCAPDKLSTVCNAVPGIPGAELCDATGLDENCDGSVNEGCSCTEGETQQCGPSTDVGACEIGLQTCSISGTMSDCVGAIFPELYDSVGNSIDEDCNGDIVCPIPCVEDPNTKKAECGSKLGGWKSHGIFVNCVSNYADELFLSNIITQEEADTMIETAIKSKVGQKKGAITGYSVSDYRGFQGFLCNSFDWFC